MKIKAFKINQYTNFWKNYNIYMSSIDIFDLKDFVYVKTVKDYKTEDNFLWRRWYDSYDNTIKWSNFDIKDITDDEIINDINNIKETQRIRKEKRMNEIGSYLSEQSGIFPTSILLWNKSKELLNIIKNQEWKDFYDIDINEEERWKNWFFIIDGQHRIFWLLTFIYNKLLWEIENVNEKKISEKAEKLNNNLDLLTNKINIILNDYLKKEERETFIKENKFELPTVIINELTEDKMAILFADINSNATKLDSNLETWIYWHKSKNKKWIRIFVHIWEKLNSNPNSPLFHRFKIPTDLKIDKFSRIWIKAFCDNWLKMLNLTLESKNNRKTYLTKPFNLLFDKLVRYEKEISEETLSFMINWLTIVYFSVFHNAKMVYWKEKFDDDNFNFINTNSLDLYLYIIKFVFWNLEKENSNNFIELFYDNKILEKINKIFEDNITEALIDTYKKYDYFEKWKSWWTGQSKTSEIKQYFQIKLYKIDSNISDKKKIRSNILQKEKIILNIV